MAKVYLDADIQAISGRLSKTTNASYARNKKTGKCYRYEYNIETKASNTTDQQAVRDTFKSKSKALSTWWTANKPTSTNADGTAHYQELISMYDAQSKYGNPYIFARSLVTKDLKMELKTTTVSLATDGQSSGGSSTTTNPSEEEM